MLPSWLRCSPILYAYLAFVFMISGLFVNVLQLFSLLFLWPVSRALYRRFNASLVEIWWTGNGCSDRAVASPR